MVAFCLLGGFESILEHIWGIYGFGILKILLLQGGSPLLVLAFAFPEYIFYWGIVVAVSSLLQWGWRSLTRKDGLQAALKR